MVRTYVKKGGHGGRRTGAGLAAGHWDQQGGRAAAAESKAAHERAEKEKKRTANEKRKEQWATMVEVSNKKPNPAPAPLQQPAAELHKETAAPDNTPAAV